jgi:TPR repeat protein
MYEEGMNGAPNYEEAATWYHLAAEKGNVDALLNLGLLYKNGRGVHKDLFKAKVCMERAFQLGNPEAKEELEIVEELLLVASKPSSSVSSPSPLKLGEDLPPSILSSQSLSYSKNSKSKSHFFL